MARIYNPRTKRYVDDGRPDAGVINAHAVDTDPNGGLHSGGGDVSPRPGDPMYTPTSVALDKPTGAQSVLAGVRNGGHSPTFAPASASAAGGATDVARSALGQALGFTDPIAASPSRPPVSGIVAQAPAPASFQPTTSVAPGQTAYLNGKQLGAGAALTPIDPKYGGGAGYSEQLPPSAPSYTGGVNGKFVGPDEAARVAAIGQRGSLATADTVAPTQEEQWQKDHKTITSLYPGVTVAGSPQNTAFVNAFNAGGRDTGTALDLANSLFGPKTQAQALAQDASNASAASAKTAQQDAANRTPAQTAAIAAKGQANQAKIDAAGQQVLAENPISKQIVTGLNDADESITNSIRSAASGVGNFFKGFGSPGDVSTAAAPATRSPVAPVTQPAAPILNNGVNPAPTPIAATAQPVDPLSGSFTPRPLNLSSTAQPATPTEAVNPLASADPDELRRRKQAAMAGAY